ncbi:MAG: ACT domain-containing protein [Candidatus Methanomethylophilaceae archaeon]|nr:ACT domain-containing protein [Candidatus Methanomethylophilaceae archaeon]
MKLEVLPWHLSVCKIDSLKWTELCSKPFFLSRTDNELSLVCLTENVPADVLNEEKGWRAFRIEGTLDFSMVGVLSKITGILARENIGIFAISTFDTDYILVKEKDLESALTALRDNGYQVL